MPTFETAEEKTALSVAEAAMCAWEHLIEDRARNYKGRAAYLKAFWRYVEAVGTSQARWTILTVVAPLIERDYLASDYDGVYDWEYVPTWLEKNLISALPDHV
jgi:hypothetical protein